MGFLAPLKSDRETMYERQTFMQRSPVSFGLAADLSFEEEFEYNPTYQLVKMYQLDRLKNDATGPMIPVEEANEVAQHFGVTFDATEDDGTISSSYVNMVLEGARKRKIIDEARERFDGSAFQKGALFGTAFLAAAVDPLNVLAGFIPFTRIGMLSAKGAFTRGLIEGALGTAILEPIVLYGSEQEKSDYGLADSLLSITFGSLLSGGLHYGTGFISEKLATASFKNKTDALSIAVAKALRDEDIDMHEAISANPTLVPNPQEQLFNEAVRIEDELKLMDALQKQADLKEAQGHYIPGPGNQRVWVKHKLFDQANERFYDEVTPENIDLFRIGDDEAAKLADKAFESPFRLDEENPLFRDENGAIHPDIVLQNDPDIGKYQKLWKFREHMAPYKGWDIDDVELWDLTEDMFIDMMRARKVIFRDQPGRARLRTRAEIKNLLDTQVGHDKLARIEYLMDNTGRHQLHVHGNRFSGSAAEIVEQMREMVRSGFLKKGEVPKYVAEGFENYAFIPEENSPIIFKLSTTSDNRFGQLDRNIRRQVDGHDGIITRTYRVIHTKMRGAGGGVEGSLLTIDERILAGFDRMQNIKDLMKHPAGRKALQNRAALLGRDWGDAHDGNWGLGIRHNKLVPLILDRGIRFKTNESAGAFRAAKEFHEQHNQQLVKDLPFEEFQKKIEERGDIKRAKEEWDSAKQEIKEQIEAMEDAELKQMLDNANKLAAEEEKKVHEMMDKILKYARCLGQTGTS